MTKIFINKIEYMQLDLAVAEEFSTRSPLHGLDSCRESGRSGIRGIEKMGDLEGTIESALWKKLWIP